MAVLAHSTPAFADSATIVGYNLSIDVDYPPTDPNNPGDTPTLTNVFIIPYQSSTGASEYVWGGPAGPPADQVQAIQIQPSSVTQTLALNDRNLFVYSLSFLDYPPDQLALFADFTDSNNVQHVVVAMDPSAAAAIAGQSFADTFTYYGSITESDLDNALQVVNGFNPPGADGFYPGEFCSSDGPCGDAETLIGEFFYGMQSVTQLGSSTPPYRNDQNLDELAALPGSFDLVSFSDGAIVGNGTASLVPLFGQPTVSNSVPEPSTWAMMLIGFAGLGYAGYRRSRRAIFPSFAGEGGRRPDGVWATAATPAGLHARRREPVESEPRFPHPIRRPSADTFPA